MMQRRKHMMSREKNLSPFFPSAAVVCPLLIFVRMKVIAVVDSIFGNKNTV